MQAVVLVPCSSLPGHTCAAVLGPDATHETYAFVRHEGIHVGRKDQQKIMRKTRKKSPKVFLVRSADTCLLQLDEEISSISWWHKCEVRVSDDLPVHLNNAIA